MRFVALLAAVALTACSDSSSDRDRPEGMTPEQEAAYDNMSAEGREYVDEQMKKYDEYCASSSEC